MGVDSILFIAPGIAEEFEVIRGCFPPIAGNFLKRHILDMTRHEKHIGRPVVTEPDRQDGVAGIAFQRRVITDTSETGLEFKRIGGCFGGFRPMAQTRRMLDPGVFDAFVDIVIQGISPV